MDPLYIDASIRGAMVDFRLVITTHDLGNLSLLCFCVTHKHSPLREAFLIRCEPTACTALARPHAAASLSVRPSVRPSVRLPFYIVVCHCHIFARWNKTSLIEMTLKRRRPYFWHPVVVTAALLLLGDGNLASAAASRM
jgi:hypothetical protein